MEMKELCKRLRIILLFGIAYMITFFSMEARNVPIHIVHTPLDDMIPFCEYFIVPYVIWYLYVCITVLYLGLSEKNLKEYYRLIANMIAGMVVFVVISWLYPNGQNLRPDIIVDSIFTWMVNLLYTVDTSTNILPSLHVFVSVACDIALCRNERFKKHLSLQWAVHILTVAICLSTMFLKQHSVIDVAAALICNTIFYPVIYRWDSLKTMLLPQHSSKELI